MADTLNYLDPQGGVNFYVVEWKTLNLWLSHLNGKDGIEQLVRIPPQALNRADILRELEDRRSRQKKRPTLRHALNVTMGRDLGLGTDWRHYQNDDGYTHFEELLIYQPKDWRKQAREYIFAYKCDPNQVPADLSKRVCELTLNKEEEAETDEEGNQTAVTIELATPILVVLFYMGMRRVDRYEPLNFLLAYGTKDPVPQLCKTLGLTGDWKKIVYAELSPLDYFLEFGRRVTSYNRDQLAGIASHVKVPRLVLMTEIDFSIIVGQRLAKEMIRKEVVTYFWGRHDKRGGAPVQKPLTMIFAGPSGNGKTEIAMTLKELLNAPIDNAYEKIDCAKLSRHTEFFGLSGAYEGSRQGSALNNFIVRMSGETEKIGVVVLDEFDKVEKEIVTGLYQVFDRGEWTNKQLTQDNGSQTSVVSCKNIIFVMTVNAADSCIVQYVKDHPEIYSSPKEEMMMHGHELESKIQKALQSTYPFTSAFLGRVNCFVPFLPMSTAVDPIDSILDCEMMVIAKLLIEREKENVENASRMMVTTDLDSQMKHSLASFIVKKSSAETGVRSIQTNVEKYIGKQLMDRCLLDVGGLSIGSEVRFSVDDDSNRISFRAVGYDGSIVNNSNDNDCFGGDSDIFR